MSTGEHAAGDLRGNASPEGVPRPLIGVAPGDDDGRSQGGCLPEEGREELNPHLRRVVGVAIAVSLEHVHTCEPDTCKC